MATCGGSWVFWQAGQRWDRQQAAWLAGEAGNVDGSAWLVVVTCALAVMATLVGARSGKRWYGRQGLERQREARRHLRRHG